MCRTRPKTRGAGAETVSLAVLSSYAAEGVEVCPRAARVTGLKAEAVKTASSSRVVPRA
jgi:hypothetical protein